MFTRAVRKLNVAQIRAFSIFSGAESNQVVYATGQLTREVDGKKTKVTVATEFKTVPAINVVVNSSFYSSTDVTKAEATTESYLVDGNGAAGKVKAISVEDYIKEGSVKFAGPAYKWTSAKVNQTLTNGAAVETEYTFGNSDVTVSSKKSVKGGATIKDSGSLKVVSRADFDAIKGQINSQIVAAQ